MSQKDVPTDIKSSFIMVLEDKRGNTFESEIVSHSKDDGKKQILWFLSPSSNRGVSLYKIENKNGIFTSFTLLDTIVITICLIDVM